MIGTSGRSSSGVGTRSIRPACRSRFQERPQALDQVLRVELADPLAVQPFEAAAIEDGAALVDVVEVEPAGELVEAEDLLLRARRPPEQGQEVDHRLGQEALGPVVGDRRLALALAHLRAVRVEDEREVGEPGHLVAERLEQQDVLRRVREVVLAPDDVADLHRRVVDDHREVVQRRPVAANDHEVTADVGGVDLDLAADEVLEDAPCPPRPGSAGRARFPAASRAARSLGRQVRAATDVPRRLVRGLLRLPVRVELLGRAVARIREVPGEQVRGGGGVARAPLHLAVRRERAAVVATGAVGALVPGDAEPVQVFEDVRLERDGAPGESVSSRRSMNVPPVRRAYR